MGRSCKGLTTSLALRSKNPNKKQKARTDISEITNQYLGNFLNELKNSPYLGYKRKQARAPARGYYPEPTKIILVVAPGNVARPEEFFRGMGIQVVTGHRYLG